MTYITNVILYAAFSYYILATLILVGTPLRPLMCRGGFAGCGDLLLGLFPGLLIVSVAAWYCIKLNLPTVYSYCLVIALGAIYPAHIIYACLLRKDVRYQVAVRENLRLFFQDSCAFLSGVIILDIFLFRNLRSADIPWVIAGNNDLLMYLKMGAYLLHFPNTTVQAGTVNLWDFSQRDVFGDFNLLAFSSFIGRTGIENAPTPVIGFVIGLAVTAIVRICRHFYGLATLEAYSIAVLVETSGLLIYLIYNYFLGQLFFISLFLIVFMALLQAIKNKTGGAIYIPFGLFTTLAASCVLFTYHVWYFQFVLIFSAMTAYSFLITVSEVTVRNVIKALVIFVLIIACCVAFSACLLPERLPAVVEWLAVITKANIAGWPLGFVNPLFIIGVPAVWEMNNRDAPVWTAWIPIVVAILFVTLMVKRFHSHGRLSILIFSLPLLALFTSLVLYLIVWLHYGFSYQQWKFASTLVLPLGFTLIASFIYALTANAGQDRSIVTGFVMLCLLWGISVNVYGVIHHWGKGEIHFSSNLKLAKQAWPVVGSDLVYVNAPEYWERMAAAVFIDAKLISFSGPTYFGPGLNPAAVSQSRATEFYRKNAACGPQPDGNSIAEYGIRPIALRNLGKSAEDLSFGTKVQFSKEISECLTLTGISGIESWGRWTDGYHAAISFRCHCGDKHHLAVKLEAGAFLMPRLRDAQRVMVRVNGKDPIEFRLTSVEPRPLLIPIPPAPADKIIGITIDLPDAISPAAVGSADTRILGLSLRSLEIIENHADNGKP